MTYEEWEPEVPLVGNPLYDAHVPQLCRSSASVAAAIAEGYPRRSAKDRARYYEYALGSLAESKVWYLDISSVLDRATINSRFEVIRSITRLLLTMKRHARSH